MEAPYYSTKTANYWDVYRLLIACDKDFTPPLSSRVSVKELSKKINDKALTFEAWGPHRLVGLVSAYFNDPEGKRGFINNVSVMADYMGNGIGTDLMRMCLAYAYNSGFQEVELEVNKDNHRAIHLYKKSGFYITRQENDSLFMRYTVHRDYQQESLDTKDHKYAYGFDFDIMHHYMMKSFAPFFLEGPCLELGSFKGDFTKRLQEHFDDITCVEASEDALREARKKLAGADVKFIQGVFESARLPKQYDNVIMTHVLEHLDDPVMVLKRINDEWLSDDGNLFLVVPNANAPSRQIAVKMGILSHNTTVTPSEKEHGHRRTYTLDTLERDAVAAGLKVIYRSGIFFKAFSNAQWDEILKTDIVSSEFLEGCYKLGQQYPDLCASIMLVCEKGN